MDKEILKKIKEMSGFVLAIGIDDEISECIEQNDKIVKCDVLNCVSKRKEKNKEKRKKQKSINIKNIRKIYKKKKVDYIICEYSNISSYLKTFVKDSVYINCNKLYFYGEVDKELIIKKYKRYDTKINVLEYKDKSIIEIDNSNSKNNIFKEFIYKIIDGVNSLILIIGDVLMG